MPSLVPGRASRPVDVFLPTWERGQPASLDVTVVFTLQNRTVAGAASVSGYALSVAKERKVAAHSEACQSAGVSFVPMVVETLGGWDEEAVPYNHCYQSLAGSTPGNSTIRLYTRHLFQNLAVCLWRGNASMWISRAPLILLQLTDRADFSVFVFVFYVCVFFIFVFVFVFLFCFVLVFHLFFISFFFFFFFKGKKLYSQHICVCFFVCFSG